MMQATAHEDAILSDVASGDHPAIEQLLIAEEGSLKRFITRKMDERLAARFDARDIVQDVFVLAIRIWSRHGWDGKVPFPAWLHAIAAEHLVDINRAHIQTRKRSVCCEAHEDEAESYESHIDGCSCLDESAEACLDRQELYERAAILIAELSISDQSILQQHVIDGCPIEDVAKLLGMSCSAVRQRQARALHRLRERLTDEPLEETAW